MKNIRMTAVQKGDGYYEDVYYTNGRTLSTGVVYLNEKGDFTNAAIQKLGQLEDIEEELGIDLVKVMKALTDGCWIRSGELGICCLDAEPRFIKPSNLLIGMACYEEMRDKNDWNAIKKDECLCIFDMFYEDINRIARLSDYGKTWALTKEELE